MPIQVHDDHVTWPDGNLPLDALPVLRQAHLDHVLGTVELEVFARYGLFPVTLDSFSRFCRHLCQWGGAPHIADQVLQTDWAALAGAVQQAVNCLAACNLVGACQALDDLPGLGVSYASKHLRFIMPERCAILDEQVRENCGYDETPEAFARYSQDCLNVSHALVGRGIFFRVADVDMAIFASLNGW
jgi:hypothetical protein